MRKKLIFSIAILSLCVQTLVLSEIYPGSSTIQQGNFTTISGLLYGSEDFNNCHVVFQDKRYQIYRHQPVSKSPYTSLAPKAGVGFITRIPSTPLMKPGQYDVDLKCVIRKDSVPINIEKKKFPMQYITLSKTKSSLKASPIELKSIRKALSTQSYQKYWDSQTLWIAPSQHRRSTMYGLRRKYNGVLAENYFHKGLDYAAPQGSAVIAPHHGKVILVGREKEGFNINGNIVILDHGQGITSAYLHLSKIIVNKGDIVKQGSKIGEVGSSGISTGPHLHFGIYINGMNVNPNNFIGHKVM